MSCSGILARKVALSLTALCLALSCTQLGDAVYEQRPHEELPEDALKGSTSIFLAGTIDMGNSTDWQAETMDMLRRSKGRFVVFNPRQAEWHPEIAGEMDYQVNWELEHLEKADIILMNFLPDSKSPITLLEMGLHAKSGRLRIICPEEFYRYDNVRITCARYGIPMFRSIEDALSDVLR